MAIGYVVEVKSVLVQGTDDLRYVGVGQVSLNNGTAQLTLTAASSANNFGGLSNSTVVVDMLRANEIRIIKAVTEFPGENTGVGAG